MDYDKIKEAILAAESVEDLPYEARPKIPKIAEGENYIFVSYSHRDFKSVYCDLVDFYKSGVRFWYDKGIHADESWDKVVEGMIKAPECAGVIFYISEELFLSEAVYKEISYAVENKNRFGINLTDDSPSWIIANIISSRSREELKSRHFVERMGGLTLAFPDEKRYLKKKSPMYSNHISEAVEEMAKRFNVVAGAPLEENEELERLALELECARSFAIRDGILEKYLGVARDVTLPEGITEIRDKAFASSQLESVRLNSSLKKIGSSAFEDCKQLRSVEGGAGLTEIGERAFMGCESLGALNLPETLMEIGSYAFSGCTSLRALDAPASLVEIGWGAFKGCTALECAKLGENLTRISGECFSECTSLAELKLPKGLEKIGTSAFFSCSSLAEIKLPMSLSVIGETAFAYCKGIRELSLEAVRSIGVSAFYNCANLEKLYIAKSVSTIGAKAFKYCLALRKIIYGGTENEWYSLRKMREWDGYMPDCYTVSFDSK